MGADAFDVGSAAARYGLSRPAAEALFQALVSGGGFQAQFNHPELGGLGQWSGGMVQIGDMFNDALKGKVGAFCDAMADTARAARGASGGPAERSRDTGAPERDDTGWPSHLGNPASTGDQNGLRYACFPEARRLAVAREGRITLYDTGDRRLTGFSQQQGSSGAPLRFSGPDGAVSLDELSVVER